MRNRRLERLDNMAKNGAFDKAWMMATKRPTVTSAEDDNTR
jgi:hypothetical protein